MRRAGPVRRLTGATRGAQLGTHLLFAAVEELPALVRAWFHDLDRGTALKVEQVPCAHEPARRLPRRRPPGGKRRGCAGARLRGR